jgi:HlyD family secretion protein
MKWYSLFFIIVIGCMLSSCHRETDYYQGYVDSKLRFISTNFSGLLLKLNVREGDTVKNGQKLFVLEPFPEQWHVDETLAKIASANAQIEAFGIKVDTVQKKDIRRKTLKLSNFSNQEEVETTDAELAVAREELNEAKSNLDMYKAQLLEAKWSQAKKSVSSNIDAIVFDVYYYAEELVPAERPVLSLLSPEDIKIIFFVPEKNISQLKIGQKVLISCDGCEHSFYAKISYISPKPEFTPPVIFSETTRSKLVFLIEARSDLETNKKLHPGQPVSIFLQ